MTYSQIIRHYGSLSKAAQALDFFPQRIQHWRRLRIPTEVQIEIAHKTGLKPDRRAVDAARRMAAYVNGASA